MAVLITGGGGFIGVNLARELVSRGDDVVVADLNPSAVPDDMKGKVKFVVCDISSPISVLETIYSTRVEGIYHLAVAIRTVAELNPTAAYRVNIEGTYNLLEAARICGLNRLVFISSHSVFPPGTKVVDANTRPMQYANTYGIAKIFGEQMGLYYHQQYGLDFRSMRFCAINGPGRPFIGGTSFLSQIFREVVNNRPCVIPVKDVTSFHNLYIKDAVRCLMGLYDAAPEQIRTRIYNISGIPTVIKDVVAGICRHVPGAIFEYRPDAELLKEFESWPQTVDDNPARVEWGWKIEYDMERWISDFLSAEKARHSGIFRNEAYKYA